MHVLEGRLAVGQLYRRDADRPYVDPAVVPAVDPGDDFRRHPRRRSYARASLLQLDLHHPGETEVDQLHFALLRQDDVAAADVSVDDVVLVQVDQSLGRDESVSRSEEAVVEKVDEIR